MKAHELMRNVMPQVTVARTMEATLHETSSVLQGRFTDETAELRQSPADSRWEQEKKT